MNKRRFQEWVDKFKGTEQIKAMYPKGAMP